MVFIHFSKTDLNINIVRVILLNLKRVKWYLKTVCFFNKTQYRKENVSQVLGNYSTILPFFPRKKAFFFVVNCVFRDSKVGGLLNRTLVPR